MPLFEQQFFEYLRRPTMNTSGFPLVLGGVPTSGGGGGGPAGGYIGYLPQYRVTFDFLEDDTTWEIPTVSASLYDNLNRIRYRIRGLEESVASGVPGHIIYDEGDALIQRSKLVFLGDLITVTDNEANDSTDVNILPPSGGIDGHVIEDNGTPMTQRANLNFTGTGVTVTDDDGNDATIIDITVSGGGGGHTIEDEGVPLTQRVSLNFVGDGVTVTDDGVDTTIVTIPAVVFSGDTTPVTLDTDADTLLSLSTQELGLDIQGANEIFAGPETGADAVPTFRPLVAADLGSGTPTGSKYLRDDLTWELPATTSGGGGGHEIQDEGNPLTQRTILNFVGDGVTVTDDAGNDATVVTISGGSEGGGHTIQEEGTPLTQRANLNFVGDFVTATDDSGNDATIVTVNDTRWNDINRYGFVDNTETTLTFDDGTYTLSLTMNGSEWSYFYDGTLCTISESKEKVLTGEPPNKATYYIYMDTTDGTLKEMTSPWTLEDDKIPVAIVIWDDTLTPKYHLMDERHTASIDRMVHTYLHHVMGTRLYTGDIPTGYTINTDTDAALTYGIPEAEIYDEDLDWILSELVEPNGVDLAYDIFYRDGATTYVWERSALPFSYTPAGYINWDSAGTLTEGQNNKYYNYYLIYTNIQGNARFVLLPGRGQFNTAALAYAEDPKTFNYTGFPIAETVLMYQFTYHASASYSTTGQVEQTRIPQRIATAISVATTSPSFIPGHVVLDESLLVMPQRGSVAFSGAGTVTVDVSDNSVDNYTLVTISGSEGTGGVSGTGEADRITVWQDATTITESDHLQVDTVHDIIRLGDQIRPSIYGTGIRVVGSDQTTDKAAYFSLRTYDDSAACDNEFGMWRSRGTSASPSPLEDDDCVGRVIYLGQHGSGGYDYAMGVSIGAYAAENLTTDNRGMELKINVTTAGQSSQLDKEYLFRDGNLTIDNRLYAGDDGSIVAPTFISVDDGSIVLDGADDSITTPGPIIGATFHGDMYHDRNIYIDWNKFVIIADHFELEEDVVLEIEDGGILEVT